MSARGAVVAALAMVALVLPLEAFLAQTSPLRGGAESCVVGRSGAFTPQTLWVSAKQKVVGGRAPPTRRSETVVMGIPKLFRWLTDQYPVINQRIEEGLSEVKLDLSHVEVDLLSFFRKEDELLRTAPIDNLYLDMNGIIHMCTHANSDGFVSLDEKEMFKRIFIYTDRIFKLVRPTRLLYLAVDGVAPRAKMNQQRSRRFRSSKEAEQLLAEMLAREGALPADERFDSNCITPGTDFMYQLGRAFRKWIAYKIETDPAWRQGVRVVFSGPDVPGEGEHKVMDYIRAARIEESDWKPDLRHCLYGLDADLIMLSLVTHEPHFSLLREKVSVRHSRRKKPKDPITYSREDFELLEVSMLREMLRLQFRQHASEGQLPFKLDLERVIDDFVFMCTFVGNDFLPDLPHLDIADGALNHMMSVYKDLLPTLGGFITDKDRIHRGRLELFLHEVARPEALYFRSRGIEERIPEFEDPDKYKDHYYKTKLGIEPGDTEAKREVIKSFLEGLYWVLQYYHRGVGGGSWSWYYPYLYAPLASDLKDLATIHVEFQKGRPFPPLMQLLSVLPPQSASFLPPPYQFLMASEESPVLEFYPREFTCDANGKRNSWETVVQIPFIEEEQLFAALASIDHTSQLTQQERLRNMLGRIWDYRGDGTGDAAGIGAGAGSRDRADDGSYGADGRAPPQGRRRSGHVSAGGPVPSLRLRKPAALRNAAEGGAAAATPKAPSRARTVGAAAARAAAAGAADAPGDVAADRPA